MSGRIILREYENRELVIGREDLEILTGPLGKHIRVTPSFSRDTYILNPGSTVGVVRLPSGIQVELQPKIPLRNLLWMLSTVQQLEGIDFTRLEEQVDLQSFDELLEIIAEAFTGMVEHRLDLGLYRNYVETEENLTTVRGRIVFPRDVAENSVLRHRTYCRLTTYSWDLPENQVIRQVVRHLSGWGFSARLTNRLVALDHQMDEISPSLLHTEEVRRFVYNRQSEDYRPIHRYCAFFLEGASLSEEQGEVPFEGFVFDMNTLFERFVTVMLRHQMQAPYSLQDQGRYRLDEASRVVIRPDLVLDAGGRHVLIGDTKYKKLPSDEHKHGDLYQMMAYCTSLQVTTGVLIYPRHLVPRYDEVRIRHSPIRIFETTIDLNRDIARMTQEIDALADRMIERSERVADPAARFDPLLTSA